MLGMHFQLGWEISGLVGHVYPCVQHCVCICEREREKEVKLQRWHTHYLLLHVQSVFMLVWMSFNVSVDMLIYAQ